MTNDHRLPSLFLSHGGGPCFWMEFPPPFGPQAFEPLRAYLAGLLKSLPQKPKAIVLISAHWEENVPTIGAAAAPAMIYDYQGFPPHTYQLNYPASGSPELAARVQALLGEADIESALDSERGFDHGVFVPMLIVDPEAQIPVVTLSLQRGLDPARHLAIGAALEPLRDEGVLIIGSGKSYHNLQQFFDGATRDAAIFDAGLTQAVTDDNIKRRNQALINWAQTPAARAAHPREDHLLPLMVAAGAGGADQGRKTLGFIAGGKAISCYAFG